MSSVFPLLAQARHMPLIAILRGLTPEEALNIGQALYQAGFRSLEVPLNRPGAIECIAALVAGLVRSGGMKCRMWTRLCPCRTWGAMYSGSRMLPEKRPWCWSPAIAFATPQVCRM